MEILPNKAELTSDLSPVIPSMQWAIATAGETAAKQFDPATGHTNRLFGHIKRDLIIDRLDRTFQTGEYLYSYDPESANDDSRLYETLSDTEIDSMPKVEPGIVVRDNRRQSTKWRFKRYCIYLHSFGSNEFYDLNWCTQKSAIKREIASTPYKAGGATGTQLALDLDDEFLTASPKFTNFSTPTEVSLILAYRSLADSLAVGVGVPRNNTDGGTPWHVFFELDKWTPSGKVGFSGGSSAPPTRFSKSVAIKENLQRRSGDVQQT